MPWPAMLAYWSPKNAHMPSITPNVFTRLPTTLAMTIAITLFFMLLLSAL